MPKIKVHPEYKKSLRKWCDIDIFLRGDLDEIRNYVIPSKTEEVQALKQERDPDGTLRTGVSRVRNSDILTSRLMRLEYKNHCKEIETHLVSQMNQELEIVEEPDEAWDAYFNDITGYRCPIQKFYRQTCQKYVAHGKAGVLVDSQAEVPESEGERQARGLRPYFVLFPASSILDWGYFETGALIGQLETLTLLLKCYYSDEGDEVIVVREYNRAGDDVTYTTYKATRDGKHKGKSLGDALEEIDAEEAPEESGTLGINFIPFYTAGEGLDDSALKDVQEGSRIRLNKQSAADNIEYMQSFSLRGFKGVNSEEAQTLSENGFVFTDNPNADVLYFPSEDPTANNRSVDRLDRSIKEMGLKQKARHADDTRAVQSAASKSKDDDSLIEFLDYSLDELESLFQFAFEALAEFDGSLNVDDVQVAIARDYRAENQEVEIEKLVLLSSECRAIGWEEGQRAAVERLFEKVLKDLPTEEKERLKETLRAAPVSVDEPDVLETLDFGGNDG